MRAPPGYGAQVGDTTLAANPPLARPGASAAEPDAASRRTRREDWTERTATDVGEHGARRSGGEGGAWRSPAPCSPGSRWSCSTSTPSTSTPRPPGAVLAGLLGAGAATLRITDRRASLAAVDEIRVLDRGHVAECGSHAELLRRDGCYAALWRLGWGESSRPDDAARHCGGERASRHGPSDRHAIAEPRLALPALGAAAVLVLCIVAIAETSDVWLVVLTVLVIAPIAAAIALDIRRV